MTALNGVGIVQCLMRWVGRCLILAPVVCFVASALLLSCGGGSSSTSTSSLPLSLFSIAVCSGPPATLTPTIRPTHTPTVTPATKTPTPTATPSCAPFTAAAIGIGTPMLLNVQGGFKHNANAKKLKYHDITSSCSLIWNVQPPAPLTNLTAVCSTPTLVTSGEFVGATDGCACLDAQVGNLVSNVVTVTVGTATCTNFCPTPTATPTP